MDGTFKVALELFFQVFTLHALTGISPNATIAGCFTKIAGCFFHLGQCLWQKIQEHGLAASYRDDDDIRQHAKMLLAVSFVLLEDVANAFDELSEVCPDALIPVLD